MVIGRIRRWRNDRWRLKHHACRVCYAQHHVWVLKHWQHARPT